MKFKNEILKIPIRKVKLLNTNCARKDYLFSL